MPSVKQIIDGHNKAILKKAETTTLQRDESKKCNCRKKEDCPLNGECMVDEVVYQATVTTENTTETYIGLTANNFKARYGNHQMSFRHEKRKSETELSKHIWQLKGENKEFKVTWKILAKAKPYTQTLQNGVIFVTQRNSF